MPDPTPATDVAAIVVTYEPDSSRLTQVLGAIAPQVAQVLVLDNSVSAQATSLVQQAASQQNNVAVQPLSGNAGLSAAYNAGISAARQLPAITHVVLLDQDSVADATMVAALRTAIDGRLDDFEDAPVTVGPWYTDQLSGRRSVVLRTSRWSLARDLVAADQTLVPTEMLISSGSLIPLSAFEQLGELDAGLFIDHIDTDWALRVRHAGRWMAVVPAASMQHQLGDRVQKVWWGRMRLLPVHAPLRLYYTFRNSLWLYRRPHSHWRWILFDLKRLLAVGLIHMLASGPRWQRLRMIMRGLLHGLRVQHFCDTL